MSTYVSKCSNGSHLSSSSFFIYSSLDCFISGPSSFVFSIFNITNIVLLLPLCIFILHHGLQQWRKSRSAPSASMSHSESFTYHLVTMEMICVFGCFFNFCAAYTDLFVMIKVGLFPLSFTYIGEMFFHLLTCLERYLAVVHPITYLSLRKERWIRIRNICIAGIWLLSLLGTGFLLTSRKPLTLGVHFFFLIASLGIVSFCSVSVLRVLIRPGPGGQAAGDRVDKSKRRAFYTILAILGVLVLRFVWDLVWVMLQISGEVFTCQVALWSLWVYMPSSLVLPLLFVLTKKNLNKCTSWKCRRN